MIKIAIIDDNPAVIFGVKAALDGNEDIEMVLSSHDIVDFKEKLTRIDVEILIVDIVLDDVVGLNFLSELRKSYPNKNIIAYSNAQGSSIDLYLERIGVYKLVSKKDPMQVLIDCILELHVSTFSFDPKASKDSIVLSQREHEILTLLGRGFSSTDIAENLNISSNTVNFHKKKLQKKFNVHTITEMIRDAVDLGIYRE